MISCILIHFFVKWNFSLKLLIELKSPLLLRKNGSDHSPFQMFLCIFIVFGSVALAFLITRLYLKSIKGESGQLATEVLEPNYVKRQIPIYNLSCLFEQE